MNIIYAEYNMYRNSIDIYTCAGYMLRIDCNKAEDGIKTTPDRKSTRLNSSHSGEARMPSSA